MDHFMKRYTELRSFFFNYFSLVQGDYMNIFKRKTPAVSVQWMCIETLVICLFLEMLIVPCNINLLCANRNLESRSILVPHFSITFMCKWIGHSSDACINDHRVQRSYMHEWRNKWMYCYDFLYITTLKLGLLPEYPKERNLSYFEPIT